ncbi:MAG TPA: sodium:proton antiporter [Lacisediminihabitans sp.]|nr:sodium:proton antiporter [Lacisediminihabitans sp.]HXD62908.1 sodium:proton antiporter [Lacisediminihabitans sp.]
MTVLIVAVLGVLAIAGATALGRRWGVATPLLLVAVGIGVSLLPFVPAVEIEPEWILAGVLPPLLYSASVSMPGMDFRREFTAIAGLSVLLVVLSSVILGAFFAWVIPDLGLAWGIALGAIVSPTDAVATSIVKRLGVSPRVVAILEGESLLNDATALVLLRAAIAGTAATVSLWGVLGNFAFAVIVAVIIGLIVGKLNLVVRARVKDATVNTVISFTVPFIASIPAELLQASGLVAAVVAGLVTGRGAIRVLSPQHRLSDSQNWRTVELILEGAVFLTMGLELTAIIGDVEADHAGIGVAIGLAASALVLTILVRAAFVGPLLAALQGSARRRARMKPRLATMQDRLEKPESERGELRRPGARRAASQARIDRVSSTVRRMLADIDYLVAQPLGWREGSIVVWAGMRGAITLAAAQTLPIDTPSRSVLVFIAFLVAGGSLLLQGGTLARVYSWVRPAPVDPAVEGLERVRLVALLDRAAEDARAADAGRERNEPGDIRWPGEESKRLNLAIIAAQRTALLNARDDGAFSAASLGAALAVLDADQLSLELKGAPTDTSE